MKAIRVKAFGGPEVLALEEVEDPRPGPGEVRVRIEAVGVNPVETYVRSGRYGALPSLPYTPGTDAAGVVEARGEGVRGYAVGDRVFVFRSRTGTYAERAICDQSQIHHLPDSVSFAQGAAIGVPCATAWRGLFQKGQARPGETVLVHGGTGGVGTAAVQLARAAGLKVVATGGSDEGRKMLRAKGAHHVLDHHAEGYLDEAARLTDGLGFNLVIELLANVNLARDLSVLARGGRVVVIGNRGTIEIDPRQLMARDASVCGMVLFNATEHELKEVCAGLGAALESGTLQPVVGKEIPLAEAARAHEEVMASGAHGKIVLVPHVPA